MAELCSRLQFALLGAGNVGKTTILQQYLYGRSVETYTETVEEIYAQPYDMDGKRKFIDFIDTAGSISFPAMRQLYVSKAHGFILVYSISDGQSFEEVKQIWEQIKKSRTNLLSIPCVVVGNKLDTENVREVETFDTMEWAYSENLGACFVEASIKDTDGINEIFNILLEQIGNTRAEQTGSFRIRSTSFSRRISEEQNILQSSKKQFKQDNLYERLRLSDKDYQNAVFADFKESDIYRVKQTQRKYFRSFSESDNYVCGRDKPDQVLRRNLSLSAKDQIKNKGHMDANGNRNIIKRLFSKSRSHQKASIEEQEDNNSPTISKLNLGTLVLAYCKFGKSLHKKRH